MSCNVLLYTIRYNYPYTTLLYTIPKKQTVPTDTDTQSNRHANIYFIHLNKLNTFFCFEKSHQIEQEEEEKKKLSLH